MLQGLAKPANDLSRACSPDDVYTVALITALQAHCATFP
jgi:phosphotransacetylase